MPITLITNQISPTFTTAQYQAQTQAYILRQMNMSFESLVDTFTTLFNMVWDNPTLTPQQVFDAFGANASQLFVISSTIKTAVNTITPGTLNQTPPTAYTINNDGTVTVTGS